MFSVLPYNKSRKRANPSYPSKFDSTSNERSFDPCRKNQTDNFNFENPEKTFRQKNRQRKEK